MLAYGFAHGRNKRAAMFGNILFQKIGNVDHAQKADPLRILFVGRRQFRFPRDLPNVVSGKTADILRFPSPESEDYSEPDITEIMRGTKPRDDKI